MVEELTQSNLNLAVLIGSRICHDLISPIGAINNGMELLELSGAARGPEIDLIAQSCANASARIRLFRVAFGSASDEQQINAREMADILNAYSADIRAKMAWGVTESLSRRDSQIACLALLCLETALPQGGEIKVTQTGSQLDFVAIGPRTSTAGDHWAGLTNIGTQAEVIPAHVQFVLLPIMAHAAGRTITLDSSDDNRVILSIV